MATTAAVSTKMAATLSGFLGTSIGLTLSYFTAVADIGVLKNEVQNLNKRIEDQMDDRWRGADARAAHAQMDERDALMMQAIKTNSQHIERLEALLRQHTADRNLHD